MAVKLYQEGGVLRWYDTQDPDNPDNRKKRKPRRKAAPKPKNKALEPDTK